MVHKELAVLGCIPVVPLDEPNARIHWCRLQDNSDTCQRVTNYLPVNNTVFYRIVNASESHDGRYKCVLTMDNYAPQDVDVTLRVISKSETIF